MTIKICINSLEGGVANYMFNLKEALDKSMDIKLILIQPYDKNKTAIDSNRYETHRIEEYYYQKRGNNYFSFKKVLAFFSESRVIIANDWFELGAISNFPIPSHVVYILHGDYDYYYNLACIHQNVISKFVCVSKKIQLKLNALLSNRINDIVYIPPLVPELKKQIVSSTTSEPLNIIFIGRLAEGKGFHLLPLVDEVLKSKGVYSKFHVAGSGYNLLPDVHKNWLSNNSNVHYLGEVNNSELRSKLHTFDVFILPSYAEGFPVSLLESMQAGLVPIVTKLDSGVPEIVNNKRNGFLVNIGDYDAMANKISLLDKDRHLLESLKKAAYTTVAKEFKSTEIAFSFHSLLSELANTKVAMAPLPKKVYRSRLDSPLLPNIIVKGIREVYKKKWSH